MDNLLMISLVGYIFQLFGLVAIIAAAGAALYAAVQVKKAAEELRKQTALLRRIAGVPPEETSAE